MPKPRVPVRVALVGCLIVVLAGCVGPFDRDVIPVVVVGTSQAATMESAGVDSPTPTVDAAVARDAWRPDQPILVNAVAGSLREVTVTVKNGGEGRRDAQRRPSELAEQRDPAARDDLPGHGGDGRVDPDRATVQRAPKVTSTPALQGAWSGALDTRVEYRPKEFWPARTTVSVSAELAGVQAGADMWGAQDKGVQFTIGRSVGCGRRRPPDDRDH